MVNRLVAILNGRLIYSDKMVQEVFGNRVRFVDGSWCNARTGEVCNASYGFNYIIVVDMGSRSAREVTKKGRVFVPALEVRDVIADVRVDTHRDSCSYIEYTITGPADQVEGIRVVTRGDTLVVERDNYDVSGDDIFVISGRNAVTITVKVPQGITVSSNCVNGNVTVGDTIGPLNARVKRRGRAVHAGRITTAQLTALLSGIIRVGRVDGDVTATAESEGRIKINDGSI